MVAGSKVKDATSFEDVLSRLKEATNTFSDAEFARKALGKGQSTISSAKERGKLPPSWVEIVAKKYAISADWLFFGNGQMRLGEKGKDTRICVDETELVMVPLVQARLAAGSGSFESSGEVYGRYAFRNEFLSRKGSPSEMVLMRVAGDSMEPEIKSDDTVLIDQSQKDPRPGQVYAVGVEDMVYLKMIDTLPGKMLLKSYNPDYPPIEVDTRGDHADGVRIIGHVVWVGRELP
ncbi:MAG: S24 family peptidase [Pseudodesulfovibrio sp.]|uniref:LexA family transcriptional regulator n=1 Tax=Pseudodesulfovibrio sp. TaxID=2035812 RepID=UPI003D0A5ADC